MQAASLPVLGFVGILLQPILHGFVPLRPIGSVVVVDEDFEDFAGFLGFGMAGDFRNFEQGRKLEGVGAVESVAQDDIQNSLRGRGIGERGGEEGERVCLRS